MATDEKKVVEKTTPSIAPETEYENSKILAALFNFQVEVGNVPKSAKGYGYNYSPLDIVRSTIIPSLQKNGLLYRQYIEKKVIEGQEPMTANYMITIISHIPSGQFLKSELEMPDMEGGKMNSYQVMGAGITYARRYALMLALGIIGEDEDTDANDPRNVATPKQNTKPTPTTREGWDQSQQNTNNSIAIFEATKKKVNALSNLDDYNKAKTDWETYKKGPKMILTEFQVKTVEQLFAAKLPALQEAQLESEMDAALANDEDQEPADVETPTTDDKPDMEQGLSR